MYKEIKIGSKTVPMTANAATEYRCKQVFNQPVLQEFMKIQPILANNEELSPQQQDILVDMSAKLGFIMAKQAEKADMTTLNEESYIEWLEDFEPMDLFVASGSIVGLWIGQKATTVKPKKAHAPTTGK